MSGFTDIDLSQLPAPDVVEALDYEQILGEMRADLIARDPDFSALVESDPAMKVLEVAAYREALLRQRVNDAARAVMLAHATGADLDNLAANMSVQRITVDPGDADARPSRPAVMESDAALRRRAQLAPEGLSTAGPAGAYVFHALSVPDVLDADVRSPRPGVVEVAVLSREGDGTASAEVLSAVSAAVNDEFVRPLTDTVVVRSAELLHYSVQADLQVYAGPDGEIVRRAARDALREYVDKCHAFGREVSLSGLYAALHRAGVRAAQMTAPTSDICPAFGQATYCDALDITWSRA